jgi:hypothetical protein
MSDILTDSLSATPARRIPLASACPMFPAPTIPTLIPVFPSSYSVSYQTVKDLQHNSALCHFALLFAAIKAIQKQTNCSLFISYDKTSVMILRFWREFGL